MMSAAAENQKMVDDIGKQTADNKANAIEDTQAKEKDNNGTAR